MDPAGRYVPQAVATTLLVGFGNALRGDDGLGPHAIATLPPGCVPPGTRLLSCHQLTPELACDLAAVERAVFIDARHGDSPGRVGVRRAAARHPPDSGFTHAVDPSGLLRLASLLPGGAPDDCWIVTVDGGDFAFGTGLSPAVAAAVPLVHRVLRCLLGTEPGRRANIRVSPATHLAR